MRNIFKDLTKLFCLFEMFVCVYICFFLFVCLFYFWSFSLLTYIYTHGKPLISVIGGKEVVTYLGIFAKRSSNIYGYILWSLTFLPFFFLSWDSFWNNSPYCKKLMNQSWIYFRNPVCKRKVKRLVNILLRRWFSFTLFTCVQITDPLLTWWG